MIEGLPEEKGINYRRKTMPYNKDGTKKKNPTKKDWAIYQARKKKAKKRPKRR